VEPEADFDHLAKAAEEMMATWAAEDEAKAPGRAHIPVMRYPISDINGHQRIILSVAVLPLRFNSAL